MSYEYSAFVRYNDPDDPLRLKNLSETPTVTAYEGGDGDSIAGASIANITTGIYKVKVTHTALEPVLFKVIPHNDDKDDFPDEALLAEEVRFVLDDGVTLANTQGAITWGQQKILADKAGEGALHIVNENEDGVGQYNSGAVGQGNLGSMQGQVNCGSIAGQYNMAEGNVGVGQHNHSEGMSGIGQSNQATFPVDGYDPALALEATLTAIKGAGWTNETLKAIKDAAGGGGLDAAGVRSAVGLASANLDTQLGNIKTDTGNIKTDTNNVTTRLTATRAGYLDKLNVAGTLANTTNAGDFKADTTGLAKTTDLSGLALEATLTAMKGAGWTNETLVAILEAIDEIDPGGGGGGATPQQIWEYANRELSTPSNYKADLTTLESRLTANRAGYLDKLNVPGTLANTNNAGTFKADVSGVPAAVWGFATRTLSGFGTLVSDIWNFATRTLSAFGFTVATSSDANVTAIKAKTDNLPASPAPAGEYDTQLDAKVSSRLASASYVAPDNASIGDIKAKTDQLTFTTPNVVDSSAVVDVGGLAEDIAEALEPIMPTPENIWTHAKRTLTMTPAEILSYIQQTAITQTRGNSWNIGIEDVSLPAAKQQIAIKCRTSQRDSESLLFIDTDGMVIINGEEYTDGGASLTYQGTTLTLKLDAKITALFHPDTYVYGIQGIDNNGVTEPYGGIFTIIADVVRAAE